MANTSGKDAKTQDYTNLIVVRRIKKIPPAHHGGAWKIAYADFVTAMMAFFLLMWLTSSTDQKMKDNLQKYFIKYNLFTTSGTSDTPSQSNRKMSATIKGKSGSGDELLEKLGNDLSKDKVRSHDAAGSLQIGSHALGTSIQIIDVDKHHPMFKKGEATLTPEAKNTLQWLAVRLREWPYQIIIEGHTDAIPFSGGSKTNIDLSAMRALAAQEVLLQLGLKKDRFLKVVGFSNNYPLIKENTNDLRNRRISITVLSKSRKLPSLEETLPGS